MVSKKSTWSCTIHCLLGWTGRLYFHRFFFPAAVVFRRSAASSSSSLSSGGFGTGSRCKRPCPVFHGAWVKSGGCVDDGGNFSMDGKCCLGILLWWFEEEDDDDDVDGSTGSTEATGNGPWTSRNRIFPPTGKSFPTRWRYASSPSPSCCCCRDMLYSSSDSVFVDRGSKLRYLWGVWIDTTSAVVVGSRLLFHNVTPRLKYVTCDLSVTVRHYWTRFSRSAANTATATRQQQQPNRFDWTQCSGSTIHIFKTSTHTYIYI